MPEEWDRVVEGLAREQSDQDDRRGDTIGALRFIMSGTFDSHKRLKGHKTFSKCRNIGLSEYALK